MSGSLEGDLVRPLGLVTLHFGYAEAELNSLLDMLRDHGESIEVSTTASLGQRVAAFAALVRRVGGPGSDELLRLVEESRWLIERRNSLVHGGIFARGRVRPNDKSRFEFTVTPEELTELADQVFHWKERVHAVVQRQVLPRLRERAQHGT